MLPYLFTLLLSPQQKSSLRRNRTRHRGAQKHVGSQLVRRLKEERLATWVHFEKCEGVLVSSVGKEANAFHGGSVNRPERLKGAYPGITRLDQLFRVNHLYIKKPLECTFLSHVVKYTLVAARRLLPDAVSRRLLSCVCRQPLRRPKHLFVSKQTAVKGTFDHRRHKSKVACCQTREPSSSQYLFAAELLWSFPEMGRERREKPCRHIIHQKPHTSPTTVAWRVL